VFRVDRQSFVFPPLRSLRNLFFDRPRLSFDYVVFFSVQASYSISLFCSNTSDASLVSWHGFVFCGFPLVLRTVIFTRWFFFPSSQRTVDLTRIFEAAPFFSSFFDFSFRLPLHYMSSLYFSCCTLPVWSAFPSNCAPSSDGRNAGPVKSSFFLSWSNGKGKYPTDLPTYSLYSLTHLLVRTVHFSL